MNKEEVFKKLEPIEKQLKWALEQNFLRMSPKEFSIVADAYAILFGTALTKAQQTCNTCRLNAIKKVAGEYKQYKAEESKKKYQKTVEEEIAEVLTKEEEVQKVNDSYAPQKKNKKKPGRKPKIDID